MGYCKCEQPEPEVTQDIDSLEKTYICSNCELEIDPKEPDQESEVL